jgi:hypothetical protein
MPATVTFTQAATIGRDNAQAQLAAKLSQLTNDADALVDFVEHYSREFVSAATVKDLYVQALEREEEKAGRGAAWLSTKLGRLIDPRGSSTDKFYDATQAAKREGALRVLREMRPYLDAAKVLEYLG